MKPRSMKKAPDTPPNLGAPIQRISCKVRMEGGPPGIDYSAMATLIKRPMRTLTVFSHYNAEAARRITCYKTLHNKLFGHSIGFGKSSTMENSPAAASASHWSDWPKPGRSGATRSRACWGKHSAEPVSRLSAEAGR